MITNTQARGITIPPGQMKETQEQMLILADKLSLIDMRECDEK